MTKLPEESACPGWSLITECSLHGAVFETHLETSAGPKGSTDRGKMYHSPSHNKQSALAAQFNLPAKTFHISLILCAPASRGEVGSNQRPGFSTMPLGLWKALSLEVHLVPF